MYHLRSNYKKNRLEFFPFNQAEEPTIITLFNLRMHPVSMINAFNIHIPSTKYMNWNKALKHVSLFMQMACSFSKEERQILQQFPVDKIGQSCY